MKVFQSFLLVFTAVVNPAIGEPPPQNVHWTRDLEVGNGYHLRWNNVDPEHLVFEIFAPVRGYVAVGFSPNGAMRGSDIVMGWVDSASGEAFIKDLYAVGNSVPLQDKHSDYELLWAQENEYGTTIRFRRQWNTCDTENDYEITVKNLQIQIIDKNFERILNLFKIIRKIQ